MLRPGILERVTVDGTDQLITNSRKGDAAGVEVRKAALNVSTESRLPRSLAGVPAVGWNVNAQQLGVLLNLPPGWRLWGALGVDEAPGSWLGQWNLWSFFLVLIIALAVGRLAGWRWGAFALAAVGLCHGELGAPGISWLPVLGAVALLGALPAGLGRRMLQVAWGISALAVAVIAFRFGVDQIRSGLFPQVDSVMGAYETSRAASGSGGLGVVSPPQVASPGWRVPSSPVAALAPRMDVPKSQEVQAEYAEGVEAGVVGDVAAEETPGASMDQTSSLSKQKGPAQKNGFVDVQEQSAIVQTGGGTPTWSWHSHELRWTGPVSKDHTARIILLPPAVNLLLSFLRVLLTMILAGRIFLDPRGPVSRPHLPERVARFLPASLLILATGLTFLGAPPTAAAEEVKASAVPSLTVQTGTTPSPELLAELKKRLTRQDPCQPECVAASSVHVQLADGELRVVGDVRAAARASWAIPGPVSSWVPKSILVDAEPGVIIRLADGFLHLRLMPGVHQVTITGPVPRKDGFAIQFPEPPKLASVDARGWQVDGVREDGTTDGSIQLTRRLTAGASASGEGDGSYAPWLEVTHVLDFGVAWSCETTVRRVTHAGMPIVVRVPLIAGMRLNDPVHQVEKGEVLVTLGRDQLVDRFRSTMEPKDGESFELVAPRERPWSEVWIVHSGIVWQCAAEGLVPVAREANGVFTSEYRPWPDERLKLRLEKPKGVAGQTVTVDAVGLEAKPGTRLLDGKAVLSVRASGRARLEIVLPKGAEVHALQVDGQAKATTSGGEGLGVTIEPGSHLVSVDWQQPGGLRILERLPRISLRIAKEGSGPAVFQPAVNATVALESRRTDGFSSSVVLPGDQRFSSGGTCSSSWPLRYFLGDFRGHLFAFRSGSSCRSDFHRFRWSPRSSWSGGSSRCRCDRDSCRPRNRRPSISCRSSWSSGRW